MKRERLEGDQCIKSGCRCDVDEREGNCDADDEEQCVEWEFETRVNLWIALACANKTYIGKTHICKYLREWETIIACEYPHKSGHGCKDVEERYEKYERQQGDDSICRWLRPCCAIDNVYQRQRR